MTAFVTTPKTMNGTSPVDLEILTVAVHPRIGGMTSWIDGVAQGLTSLGWKVRLIGISDEWSESYRDAPFEAVNIPMPAPRGGVFDPMDKWSRWRAARDFLLHWSRTHPAPRLRISDSTPGVLGTVRRMSFQDKVPWAVLAGGDVFAETVGHVWSPLLHRTIRLNMNHAVRVFVDGPDLRQSLSRRGIPTGRIEVQYHGVDMDTFKEKGGSSHFYPETSSEIRLAWHGRLAETGGPLRFIGIAREFPDCVPRMCGDGPQRVEVLTQLRALGHPEWHVGSLTKTDVAALLGEAECGVYPLRAMAGIPRVLLESMAVGLAVVTSETGACRELITDGVDGFICRDEASMLEILRQLMKDFALRQRIGAAARETILESWTEEAILRGFARKLEGLMA